MLDAILQNFISLSIQGVRSSFFAQIEAEIKEIPHKKLILKIKPFEGMILISTVKSQNSRFSLLGSQVQTPRTGLDTICLILMRWDGYYNEVISDIKHFPGLVLR